jgi:hypothetical protein
MGVGGRFGWGHGVVLIYKSIDSRRDITVLLVGVVSQIMDIVRATYCHVDPVLFFVWTN